MIAKRVTAMKQLGLGLNLSTKRTRKREFLEEMERVVPWGVLVQIVEPHYPKAKTGRPPFGIETMLRIHYLQQWFGLSDPAMEEALHDVPLYREFAKLGDAQARLPDETTILRFRHLLERHNLAPDMLRLVNDILLAKGLMLRTGTAANVNDLNVAGQLLHGEEQAAFGDAGYQGVHKRAEAAGPTWHVAMRPGLRRKLNPFIERDFVAERVEKMKASIRAKVEHPFRVLKRQFGFTKVRYRGLAKNTAQIVTLFALSNLWMARRHLIGAPG